MSETQPKANTHVIITGTGRAGTSLLMRLFVELEFDTGFTPEQADQLLDNEAHADLERDWTVLTRPGSPYIAKSPDYVVHIRKILAHPAIKLEHVLIPIRDVNAAAASRVRQHPNVRGGLVGTSDPAKQRDVLLARIYHLCLALAEAHVPVTFLQYPKLAKDPAYLFKKLEPVLAGVQYPRFLDAFRRIVKPHLVKNK